MQMRIRDVALAAAVVTAAACGGGGGDGDGGEEATPTTSTTQAEDTTSSTTASTTSTTAAPDVDPTVIPDDPADIDKAYVEAVLAEHNRVIGDALRLQLEGADPKEIVDRYNAVYVPEVADFELNDLFNMTTEELARLRRPPGDGKSEVTALRAVTLQCIVVEVLQYADDLVVDPPPPFEAEVILRRAQRTSPVNGTAWQSGSLTGRTEEGSSCDG